jgi:hypothetical protein
MNAVAVALYTTLSGGTALTSLLGGTAVYQQQAPDGAALPYVVFSKQAGGPENIDPHDRRDLTYFVRAYAGSAKTAGQIDAAVEALLHRHNLPVTGWNTLWCARDADLETVEPQPNGVPVYMAGGMYRIRIV